MRTILQIISWLSLIWLVLPALFYFYGAMELDAVKFHMLLATVVWFVFTPLWMGKEEAQPEADGANPNASR